MALPHRSLTTAQMSLHPTTGAVRAALVLLLAVGAAGTGLPQAALAAESSPAASLRDYHIPAGSLRDALSTFAIAAGINLSTQGVALDGLATPGFTEHLWATTLAKLAVDQPNYSGYKAALAERGEG